MPEIILNPTADITMEWPIFDSTGAGATSDGNWGLPAGDATYIATTGVGANEIAHMQVETSQPILVAKQIMIRIREKGTVGKTNRAWFYLYNNGSQITGTDYELVTATPGLSYTERDIEPASWVNIPYNRMSDIELYMIYTYGSDKTSGFSISKVAIVIADYIPLGGRRPHMPNRRFL